MALQTPLYRKTFGCPDHATNALAAGLIVVADATKIDCVKRSGAGSLAFVGVCYETPSTMNEVGLDVLGITQVTAGGTVTVGDAISSDSAGKGVTATALAFGGATVTQVIGTALSSATSGNLFDLLIQPFVDKV